METAKAKCVFAKVKITADGTLGGVIVDGHDFSNATAVHYSHKAGEHPILTVELLCDAVEIEAKGVEFKEVPHHAGS